MLEISRGATSDQIVMVVHACAGIGVHNMHGDTPSRHMRQEAHYLVDLAVLLYTMGLQITYQRLSAQVPPSFLLRSASLLQLHVVVVGVVVTTRFYT